MCPVFVIRALRARSIPEWKRREELLLYPGDYRIIIWSFRDEKFLAVR
jgi:hypothetical protein